MHSAWKVCRHGRCTTSRLGSLNDVSSIMHTEQGTVADDAGISVIGRREASSALQASLPRREKSAGDKIRRKNVSACTRVLVHGYEASANRTTADTSASFSRNCSMTTSSLVPTISVRHVIAHVTAIFDDADDFVHHDRRMLINADSPSSARTRCTLTGCTHAHTHTQMVSCRLYHRTPACNAQHAYLFD
jgi:homoaconitase/3-isopropylmalate dehydratase large subunit